MLEYLLQLRVCVCFEFVCVVLCVLEFVCVCLLSRGCVGGASMAVS